MEKKEIKKNIRLGIIAFIAATLLLSSCQKSQIQEEPSQEQGFQEESTGELSMDGELNKLDEQAEYVGDEEIEDIGETSVIESKPLKREDLVLDLTNNTEASKWDLEFLGENKVAIKKCDDNSIETFKYDVIKAVDPKVGAAKDYKIVSVRASAFAKCDSLKEFSAQYVTSIKSLAFSMCSLLKSVRVAETITEIGSDAFNRCTSLEEFNYSDDNGDGYTYVWLPVSLVLNQSPGVGSGAFAGCRGIKNICFYFNKDMEDKAQYLSNLKKINAGAFKNCTGIESINYAVSTDDEDDTNGLGDGIYEHFSFKKNIDSYTLVATEIAIEEN